MLSDGRFRRTVEGARSSEDSDAAIEAANRASERASIVHLGFVGLCAYVLLVVFGTSDVDLLVGKSVRLPVINFDVSLIAFYLAAPALIFIGHANLLIQLFLLARKLYGWDALISKEIRTKPRIQLLGLFSFNHYLLTPRQSSMTFVFAVLVTGTVLVLPLVSLIAVQIRFLAYQNDSMTWLHRIVVWLDVALVIRMWPSIVDPGANWHSYFSRVRGAALQHYARTSTLSVLLLAALVCLFCRSSLTLMLAVGFLVLTATLYSLALGLLKLRPMTLQRIGGRGSPELSTMLAFRQPPPLGAAALVSLAVLGTMMPLAAHIDGEWLESLIVERVSATLPSPSSLVIVHAPTIGLPTEEGSLLGLVSSAHTLEDAAPPWVKASRISTNQTDWDPYEQTTPYRITLSAWDPRAPTTAFNRGPLRAFRHLALRELALMAEQTLPETLADLRSGDRIAIARASKTVRSIDLTGRNLRGAQLQGALLVKAVLRGADLRRANLSNAHLYDVDFTRADLRRAVLMETDLMNTKIYSANFAEAQLGESHLDDAKIVGSDFTDVYADGATLNRARISDAKFDGAFLRGAMVYSANIDVSSFNGAHLSSAEIVGGSVYRVNAHACICNDLRVYGAIFKRVDLGGADLRNATLYGSRIAGSSFDGGDLSRAVLYALDIGEIEAPEVWSSTSKNPVTKKVVTLERKASFRLVDVRGSRWIPMEKEEFDRVSKQIANEFPDGAGREATTHRLQATLASGQKAPLLGSCLYPNSATIKNDELSCQFAPDHSNQDAYSQNLRTHLKALACLSTHTARGVSLGHAPNEVKKWVFETMNDEQCAGFRDLNEEEKAATERLIVGGWGQTNCRYRSEAGASGLTRITATICE